MEGMKTNCNTATLQQPAEKIKNNAEKFVHFNETAVPLQRQTKGTENAGINGKNYYH